MQRKPPKRPTSHKPGTKERVAVYARRWRAGLEIHHPNDPRYVQPVADLGSLVDLHGRCQRQVADLQQREVSVYATKLAEQLQRGKSVQDAERAADAASAKLKVRLEGKPGRARIGQSGRRVK